MSPVYLRKGEYTRFWCPGCDDLHMVSGSWQVTEDDGALTISPSILVYESKKLINDYLEMPDLVAPENIATTPRCHSFVGNGRIEFLSDSTHLLSGQTTDLPELPRWCITDWVGE